MSLSVSEAILLNILGQIAKTHVTEKLVLTVMVRVMVLMLVLMLMLMLMLMVMVVEVAMVMVMVMVIVMVMVMVLLLTRRGCAKMPHSQGLFPQERLAKVNSRTDSRICMVTASTSLWFENTPKKSEKERDMRAHNAHFSWFVAIWASRRIL